MAVKKLIGGNWKYKVYFDPEADEHTGRRYAISDDELRTNLANLVDAREKIQSVTAYKVRLSEFQITQFLLYHMFIVFETVNWWWSIEKNDQGITIQRSKFLFHVRERYRQTNRKSGICSMATDDGKKSVNDLIDWLWMESELNEEYDILLSNCQRFGKKVFNFVANHKKM